MIPGSASPLLLSSAGAYNLTKSLRFRGSASAYLNRTPASAGNRQTWTLSTWIKRGTLGTEQRILFANDNGLAHAALMFNPNNTLQLVDYTDPTFNPSGQTWLITTSAVYRDPSAWYHIVAVFDTTNATSSNRMQLYVNGSQITAFSSTNYPTQNYQGYVNNNVLHGIGARIASPLSNYFDGYMAEINMVDGQALTPSSFGQTSTTTGVWIPKKYSGSYGTNGFYLPFTDNSALTTSSNVGLGKDFSGNANYWTTNNISITAGTTYDSMTDVPTLTSATAANYATFNGIGVYTNLTSNVTYSNGNLQVAYNSADVQLGSSIRIPNISGKYYLEFTATYSSSSNGFVGLFITNGSVILQQNGTIGNFGVCTITSTTGVGYSSGQVISFAIDADTKTATIRVNNTVNTVIDFSAVPTGVFIDPAVWLRVSGDSFIANYGQQPFTYTPPTGFAGLNTFNLPTPTIGATATTTANKYFNAITYTGNGGASSNTTQNITTNFYPDLTWVKGRDSAFYHRLTSTGLTQPNYLSTNSTDAEGSLNDQISALASTYFQVKAAGSGGTNQSGLLYVGWAWNANSGSTVSNAAGSITSTVSANTTAGFSIVTYTGNGGTSDTVGHGLGVAPSMIIYKVRSNALRNWIVYHASLGSTRKINLNLTDADEIENGNFGGLSPTSTTFGVGYAATNGSSQTFVAYCFAQVAGYSAFGSYAGNSSTDGPFVYTGFRPRFVLLKIFSGNTGNWLIVDSARNTYNVVNLGLNPDAADAEFTTNVMDFTSNGFKLRSSAISFNGSGCNYIYMAFAESPFKYANAR
jgi:hypothetical protein